MGFFNIYAGIGHEKVRDTVRAIKEELALLQQNSVSEDELSKAKEQLKSGYIFGQENVNSRMFANGKNVLLRGKTTDQETVIRKINEVTVEDVDKIKSMICDTEKYSGVLVTNKRVDLRRMFRGQ
jgi:predicted Zn-dependent peptidase